MTARIAAMIAAGLALGACSVDGAYSKFKQRRAGVSEQVDSVVKIGVAEAQQLDLPRLERTSQEIPGFAAAWLELHADKFPVFFAWVRAFEPRKEPAELTAARAAAAKARQAGVQ